MQTRIIAGNWKMHKTLEQGLQLVKVLIDQLQENAMQEANIILFPPFTHLEAINQLISAAKASNLIHLGAQNCHHQQEGAFTGEVSAAMLRSVGARYVLVGHSERRKYFGEDPAVLATKVDTALMHALQPIFCCGEPWPIREKGLAFSFVCQQLAESLFHLTQAQIAQVIIAYEPVWAIGTGKIPSLLQIQDMHKAIRKTLAQQYNAEIAADIPILYGGSCNAQNAATILSCLAVDGALIGGASLEANSFMSIINACSNQQ